MTGPLLKTNHPTDGGRRRLLPGGPRLEAAGWGWRRPLLGALGAMAMAWVASSGRPIPDPDPAPGPAAAAAALPDPEPVASVAESNDAAERAPHVALRPVAGDPMPEALQSPIARALRAIDECQARYEQVRDYVCTFRKRERIDGRLSDPHVMLMKARARPRSVYLKFRRPAAGREAIFIEGQNDGKILAHDVGLGRLIAGTLCLDPNGPRAMADCRHPMTQAGIGPLLDTLEARWTAELDSTETRVEFRDDHRVGDRPCTRITVTHTRKDPAYLFHQVHLYVDRDLGLPIRFEGYDWPAGLQADPQLVEEYTYSDLQLNVGLGDIDFDVTNEDYAFGRF